MSIAETGRTILPVFGLIGLGYGGAASRLLPAATGEALGEFVFLLPVPALMFRTIAGAHFPDTLPWALWFSYFGGAIVAWALGSLIVRAWLGVGRAEAVIVGASSAFSNTVMIGIPLIYTAFGDAGTVPLFLIISVHLPVMMVAGTFLSERAARLDGLMHEPFSPGRLFQRIGYNLLTNSIVIAVVAGLVWRQFATGLGGPVGAVVDQLAAAAVPCALISLGVGLRQHGLVGQLPSALLAAVLKLGVMPAVIYLIASRLSGLPPLWVAVATLCGALPSGINSYLFAVRFKVGQAGASSAITLSCLLGIVTLTMWLHLLQD